MNKLNFFPYYEALLEGRRKTTTLRRDNYRHIVAGDRVLLTVGWDESSAKPLHEATITNIYEKKIGELNDNDLHGESPDCKSPDAARFVLSAIYRKVLAANDVITVIKFVHQ